jgi:predicted DCC family thiol-disulfide oxidoreductase YuxK
MQRALHVASPPPKPLMIYDGECDFCKFWIARWQCVTTDRVKYLPFQDPRLAAQFPEIPRTQFESSVQLIEPDGAVYHSAEAVFRSLAFNPRKRQWIRWYERSSMFARITEWSYRCVSRHRKFFFLLTRLFWRVPKSKAG